MGCDEFFLLNRYVSPRSARVPICLLFVAKGMGVPVLVAQQFLMIDLPFLRWRLLFDTDDGKTKFYRANHHRSLMSK